MQSVKDGKARVKLDAGWHGDRGRQPKARCPRGSVTVVVRPEHANLVKPSAKADLHGTSRKHRLFRHRHAFPCEAAMARQLHRPSAEQPRSAIPGFKAGEKVGIVFERRGSPGAEGLTMASAAADSSRHRTPGRPDALAAVGARACHHLSLAAVGPLFIMLALFLPGEGRLWRREVLAVLARWLVQLFSSSATSSTTRCPLPMRISPFSGARSSCRF